MMMPGMGQEAVQAQVPGMAAAPPSMVPTPLLTMLPSPLDIWAFRKYGMMAGDLQGEELDELYDHVLENANNDVDFWEGRNDRFLHSQKYWEIGSRYGKEKDGSPMVSITRSAEEEAKLGDSEIVELNDGYLTVDKITNMVAGAAWSLDVPAYEPGLDDTAQDIEDLLRHMDKELEAKHALGLNATFLRDEVHYAALRGWLTGIVTPDPTNPSVPVKYVLEDPMFVYPRYSGDELVRVVRRYSITALEAQVAFPMAFEFLLDYDEEEELEVTEYFDKVYRMALLSGQKNATWGGNKRTVLQPMVRHGYRDIDGQPINPWIIVTPRGSPTRRFSDLRDKADRKKAAAMIGLDVLHPIKHIIDQLEKLSSMQMTEVAKGVNPPHIIYWDGTNKPYELDMGIGAENYMLLGQQDYKPIDSTTMKPDAMPLMNVLGERLQRGSLPAVLYGQAGFTLAGYAINLLSQGAQDVVRPILDGVKLFREMRFRRMLEMYVNISHTFAGPLSFSSMDPNTERMYTGVKQIDPAAIKANGVCVNVTYDTVLPRDAATLMAAGIGAMQAGGLPLYDFMKDYAGIKDPRQAMQRLAEGLNYQDPLVQKWLAKIAGMKSGNELLKQAIQMAEYEQQMMMQMQMQMAAQQQGAEGNTNLPGGGGQASPEDSPPANQNPLTAAANQLNNVSAAVNVGSGASAPNADTAIQQFLGMA